MFFSKTCIAEATDVGLLRLVDQDIYIPYFTVKATLKPGILAAFFREVGATKLSATNWQAGFRRHPLSSSDLVLDLRNGKKIIGISFNLEKQLRAVIGIMESGWVALQLEDSSDAGEIVSLEVTEQAAVLQTDLYPQALHNMVKKLVKAQGLDVNQTSDFVRNTHQSVLEKWKNWPTEATKDS